MTLPHFPHLSAPVESHATLRQRLLTVRATLQKACRDLDEQINGLEMSQSSPRAAAITAKADTTPLLFESAPSPSTSMPEVSDQHAHASIVLEATAPAALDPALEQATLEELNFVLSKAFAQISTRTLW